jgi:hypothetical protein
MVAEGQVPADEPASWLSLRKISAALAAHGHLTGGGKPYDAMAVRTMLAG